jgi:probable HAF family extracellular repeat protein
MIDLGTLPGGNNTNSAFATDINDAGQIVGIANGQGFLFSNGQMTALPEPSNATEIFELRINGNGQISGLIKGSNFEHIGRFSNGAWTDLGAPAGSTQVLPRGINLSGQIVGVASIPGNFSVRPRKPGRQFAIVLINGAWVDLNTLIPANSGFTLIDTSAINDSGQILCTAESSNSSLNSTLLLSPK